MKLLKMFLCGGEFPVSEYPLGLGYLKANCEVNDWKIEIVNDKEDLIDCDMIGLSANAWGIKEAVDFNNQTNIPVILGGQGTMWDPIDKQPFKHIVKGEGENALKKILMNEVTDKIVQEPLMSIDDMNKLSFPERHGPLENVSKNKWLAKRLSKRKNGAVIPILTSRGCPFRCTFCSTIVHWPKARFHSAEYFIEEVEYIIATYPNFQKLYIMDDLFISHKKRLRQIHEMWMTKGWKFNVQGFIRSDIFTDEIAKLIKDIGFTKARFGGESASNRVLKYLEKGETVEDHINAIEVARRNGLVPGASWMYDIPTETPEEKQMTVDFIKKHKVKMMGYYKFMPFPGTKFWSGEDLTKTDMRVRVKGEAITNNGVVSKQLASENKIDKKLIGDYHEDLRD